MDWLSLAMLVLLGVLVMALWLLITWPGGKD